MIQRQCISSLGRAFAPPTSLLRSSLASTSSSPSFPSYSSAPSSSRSPRGPAFRAFSTTSPARARVDHYGTLKLPRNASRQQIKARFYELSKKHHPDAPGGSVEAFHAINDAYSVLGDPAQRDAYDRSHTPASQRAGAGSSFHPHSPEARRTASGPHRAWGGKPPPGAHWSGSRRHEGVGKGMGMGSGPADMRDMRGKKWGRKEGHGLGAAAAQRERENRLDNEVEGESVVWRTIVIAVLLTVIVGLAGRLTASADSGEEDELD